ncbi:MAG: D-2-hydroxyacid dehydrogenase [Ruminococcus sp.]|nr:D-2-hydroxyacid dehydrogenase [Ruminococcus sp.]
MKIILTDAKTVTQGDLSLEPLKEFGEVVVHELTDYDEIAERVRDADAIICNKTPLNADTLRLASRLKYIGLFATGYNNIDTEYCDKAGITVCNAGSYSSDAVCQHTFALILECMNRIGDYSSFVAEGNWKKSKTFSPFVFPLSELAGKTLGIVGYGSIGKAVGKVAKAFNMNVLAYKRHPEKDSNVTFADFDTVLRESDIITVHCPLNKSSYRLFDKDAFSKMKDGAIFINTARGAIMDEFALKNALESGKLAYAGIDVLEIEPMDKDCPICGVKNCFITPHIAWAPMETRERLMGIVCDNLRNFLSGAPKNVVNHPELC